jgi:hypothetical protein
MLTGFFICRQNSHIHYYQRAMFNDKPSTPVDTNSLLKHVFGTVPNLMGTLAPDGWEHSPYVRVAHPTLEQQYVELTQLHANMNEWITIRNKGREMPSLYVTPSFDEFCHQHATDTPATVQPIAELLYVYGGCVWAVFSNNHQVIAPSGEPYSLGSFRGSGRYLADFLEQTYPDAPGFTYMDFYCADFHIERRTNTIPVYTLIFSFLQQQGCDWLYAGTFDLETADTPPPIILAYRTVYGQNPARIPE